MRVSVRKLTFPSGPVLVEFQPYWHKLGGYGRVKSGTYEGWILENAYAMDVLMNGCGEDEDGDSEFGEYVWKVGKRYFREATSTGYVERIDRETFETIKREYSAYLDEGENAA